MKRISIFLLSAWLFTSCTDFDVDDLGFGLQNVDSYVAFANTGGTVTPIVRNLTESSAVSNLRIEVATGTLSDITVTYQFSGTAVYGTDFIVVSPGGSSTAAGGTILLKKNLTPAGLGDLDFVNLGIDPVTDGVTDGSKSLVVTLVSAVNADGKQFTVGRGGEGGTVYLKTATINIADVN